MTITVMNIFVCHDNICWNHVNLKGHTLISKLMLHQQEWWHQVVIKVWFLEPEHATPIDEIVTPHIMNNKIQVKPKVLIDPWQRR